MRISTAIICTIAIPSLAAAIVTLGQQPAPRPRHIGLDVIVTNALGKPVPDLTAQDFTLLDNGQPARINFFLAPGQAVGGGATAARADPPAEIVILIDSLSAAREDFAVERREISTFLRFNDGKLTHPVSILIFDGKQVKRLAPASKDGNDLANILDKSDPPLHIARPGDGYYGATDRVEQSLAALGNLANEAAKKPGKELLLWIGPGWDLLPGTDARTTNNQMQKLFEQIVAMSSMLRRARVILYAIDPQVSIDPSLVDPTLASSHDQVRFIQYKDYLKGVKEFKKASVGNLSLQVLATQSGGRVITLTKLELSGEIATCVTDADADYLVSFDAPPTTNKDEYHDLKITLDKPGLTARTRSGYYNQP